MSASFGDKFGARDFEADKYVKEISAHCIGGAEFNAQKSKLQALSDDTHSALKKNVFQHYEQFIDTAKDISYLAGEMYQISQTLRDQRTLIQNILDTSILGPKKLQLSATVSPSEVELKTKSSEEDARKKMLSVIEKVEGASDIVENENRTLIYEGDLLEIDPDNYSAVQRKRGCLFNDGIMLAVWVTNRRGPQRYKFQAFYELGSIGLVMNIRDPECPKHTFKLLIFPNVHLLQCPNQQEKDSWCTHIEGLQKILRNPHITSQKSFASTKQNTIESPTSDTYPGFTSMESERMKSLDESLDSSVQIPEWLRDLPEDLDVYIAQRNFVEAVDLYDSFKEYAETAPMNSAMKEIKARVDSRIRGLIDIIVDDLEILTPAKVLQGGPRSILRSVDLLVRLGRESQASQLFLAHRSAYIKQRLKRLKTEGRSQLYMDHLSDIFFQNIAETMKEYRKCFDINVTSVAACLVVWTNNEVTNFVNNFCRQLFTPQTQLSAISKLVTKLRSHISKLIEFGIDVSFVVDSTLLMYIQRTLTEAKDKLIEAIRHRYRSKEEAITAIEFVDKTAQSKFASEMADLGVENWQVYLRGTTFQISSSTVAFIKSWLHFCLDIVELAADDWQNLIETAICEVLLTEISQLEHSWNKSKKKKDARTTQLLENDVEFVLGSVNIAANKIFEKTIGRQFPELLEIAVQSNFTTKPPRPASKSPTKSTRFTSSEYL